MRIVRRSEPGVIRSRYFLVLSSQISLIFQLLEEVDLVAGGHVVELPVLSFTSQ